MASLSTHAEINLITTAFASKSTTVGEKNLKFRNEFRMSSYCLLQKNVSFSLKSDRKHFRSGFSENSLLESINYHSSTCNNNLKMDFLIQCGMQNARDLLIQKKIKACYPKEAGKLISQNSWKVLDIRPIWEKEKAFIKDSIHVPYFIEDDGTGILTLVKKQIQFGFGGWWLGQRLTKINENFLSDVEKVVSDKGTSLLVVCGEGLRSMLAAEDLYEHGFTNLIWLAGGLNNSRDGDFENVQGETKLQFATAGGVQGILIKVGQQLAAVLPKSSA